MSTTVTPAPSPVRTRRPRLWTELWFQVLVGAALGIALGVLFPRVGAAMAPLNDWFIALIKMIVVPVVFCVIVNGIASMDNLRKAGRIGIKSLGYFLALSLLSMVIGLVVANLFHPGAGMHVDVKSLNGKLIPQSATTTHLTLTGFISGLIPSNLLGAFTGNNMLAALVAALLVGIALNKAGEAGRPLVSGMQALQGVVFTVVAWVMRLAPLGTFGALAAVVATSGAQSLKGLGYLILLFFATCVIYVVVVLGLIMRLTGLSLFGLMRFLKAELLIALSTCSSEAILPQLVKRLEQLGVGKPVVGIVVPAGFSFNLDGSAVYLTMAFLFLAQATDSHLTLAQQLVAIAIMMLTSKGTAGIAGGAFIVLASTISAIGMVPVASLALIVGIDRILNEGRVFINVLGNAVAAIVVGKWENDFDHERAKAILSSRRQPEEFVDAPELAGATAAAAE